MRAEDLGESVLGIRVLPQLPAVVKQDTGEKQVAIELGVNRTQRICRAHHLGHVFDKAAAAGMVVSLGGGSAPKAVTHVAEKLSAQCVEPGVNDGLTKSRDIGKVVILFFPSDGVACVKGFERLFETVDDLALDAPK